MALAPLPADLKLDPFFVLRWNPDLETLLFASPHAADSTFDLGDRLPEAVRTLSLRGLHPQRAEYAIDCAREFGAVQVIPRTDRVLSLARSRNPEVNISEHLIKAERDEGGGYVHI